MAPFFSDVICFVPTEDDITETETALPVNVQQMVPAPLGPRLKSFNMLVKDAGNWALQMGAGEDLHFENIISMAEQQQSEAVHDIIKDIKGRKEGRVLAVARLFLRLALENDRREAELDGELRSQKDAGKVIADILGGEEAPDRQDRSLLDTVASLFDHGVPELSMMHQRLRSWTAIATKYEGKPLKALPLGVSVGAKDRMDIAFESVSERGSMPKELLSLNLPAMSDDLKSVFDASFTDMWNELMDLAVSGPWNTSSIELAASKVQRAWDRRMGKKERGRVALCLTAYPGVSCMKLMKKAAGLSDKLKTSFLEQDMNVSFFIV